MSAKRVSIPRLAIFCAGLIIINIIMSVLNVSYRDYLGFLSVFFDSNAGTFIWFAADLLYLGYGLPFIFVWKDEMNKDSFLVGGTVYYYGMYVFTGLTLALVYAIINVYLPVKLAVCGEIIAVFVFVVYIYLASASAGHVERVAAEESVRTQLINTLKQETRFLKAKSDSLGMESTGLKNRISKIAENIGYLSPSGDEQALELEKQMIDLVVVLSSAMDDPMDQVSGSVMNEHLKELEKLYQMRKMIY